MRWWFLILVPALVIPPLGRARADAPGLFGTSEKESSNMSLFTNWNQAVARAVEEKSKLAGTCDDKKMNACHYKVLLDFTEKIRDKDDLFKIKNVNDFMNRAKYVTDQINYNAPDYWASPGQFIEKQGDCEDYAIAKYIALKLAGFPADKMRVVAVQDLNLKVGHAVLAVYVDGKALILDNQIKQVVDSSSVKHYQPVFSINEKAWWRHTK